MTHEQKEQAWLLERELRTLANKERGIAKRQTLVQSAALLRSLAEQSEWQPIATAPRDGTYILLAGESGYVTTPLRAEIGFWQKDAKHPGWRNHANDHFTDGGEDPIYWMPLPTTPQPE